MFINDLHNVSLVNSSNSFTIVSGGIIKSEFGNSKRVGSGDNLKTLNYTRHTLVLSRNAKIYNIQ